MIGKKKKLIVPVVAIMMCAVALAGVVYAYSASMSVDNNSVPADDLTIDLATGVPGTDIVASGLKAATFTDNLEYVKEGNPPAYVKYNTVKGEGNEGLAITYAVKVTGAAAANKIIVKATNIEAYYATVLGSSTIGGLYKIAVSGTNDINDAVELTDNDTEVEIAISKAANAECSQSIYVFIISTGNVPVIHARGAYDAGWKASTYTALVSGAAFTLSMEATYVAPAP